MSWRPANIEPENNRAWAGVHWLNQEIRAESILRPTAARADSTALSRRSELSLITPALSSSRSGVTASGATAAQRHQFRMLISRAGRSGSFRYSR